MIELLTVLRKILDQKRWQLLSTVPFTIHTDKGERYFTPITSDAIGTILRERNEDI